jgi:hypothetical protein
MRGRWRFLPRTALLYEGAYTWVTYSKNTLQSNGSIARSSIGLNGLITNHFALLGMIGWAGTFYDNQANVPQQQFDSLVAQAEVKWYLGGQSSLPDTSAPVGLSWVALGYTRDMNNSYLGHFYQRDRGYLQLSYLLGGSFVASLNAGVANLSFPENQQTGNAFSEQRIDGTLFGEYRLSDTVGINVTVNYIDNITNEIVRPLGPNGMPVAAGGQDDLAFQEWQAFLGARWFL